MTKALLKGADGANKRERGRRLQPDTLEFLTLPGATPSLSTHIAAVRSDQAENRFPVRPAVDDATREITNAGHLAKAIMRVHALKKLRYGRKRVPADASRDLYRLLAAIEAAAAARDPGFVPDLHDWSARHLCLSEAAIAEVRAELVEHATIITPQFVGEQIGLTDAERDLTEFWDAEAVDMTADAREQKKRAKDRERKRAERAKSRKGDALALARQLYPNASRATHFRKAKKLRGTSHA